MSDKIKLEREARWARATYTAVPNKDRSGVVLSTGKKTLGPQASEVAIESMLDILDDIAKFLDADIQQEHFRYELGDIVKVMIDGFWKDGWVTTTARRGIGIQTDETYVEIRNKDLHDIVRFQSDKEN